MRRPTVGPRILLIVLAAPLPAAGQAPDREADVRAAVATFGRAFADADVARLRTLLTDDYLHVNGASGDVLNRDDWLRWVATRRDELDAGDLVIHAYDVEELEVRVHGEAAVATGIVRVSGERRGVPFTSQVRFTNVWVRRGDGWRRAAFHDSPLPESGR